MIKVVSTLEKFYVNRKQRNKNRRICEFTWQLVEESKGRQGTFYRGNVCDLKSKQTDYSWNRK